MTEKKFLQLQDIGAYRIAYDLSNNVWNIVLSWDSFAKWTIGKQFVEAIDSISANIAEGFGRYSKKDKIKFYRYAEGSRKESLDWCKKAFQRGLLKEQQYRDLYHQLQHIPKELYALINFTNQRLTI